MSDDGPLRDKKFSRRAFLRAAGISLLANAACQPAVKGIIHASGIADLPTRTPQPTPSPKATYPPTPTPQPTPTFAPDQLQHLLRQEEMDFLAAHEVRDGDTSRPVIMMTYDDNGKYAQVRAILDAFNRFNAKATFFFIGEKIWYSAKAVRAVVEEGHLLGCHGWEHINLLNLNEAQVNRQFARCFESVHEVVPGYRLRFIRFPFGNGNGNERLLRIAAQWGMQHVYWTTGSGGLDKYTYDNVIRNAGNGAIVLSHMLRPFDVSQADRIVESLVEMGYSLETVETGRKPEDTYMPPLMA